MSLARGANYSQAGLHSVLDDRYEVRDNVYLRDATAGSGYQVYEGSPADDRLKTRSFMPGLTVKSFLIIVGLALFTLLVVYQVRAGQIRSLAVKVNELYDQTETLTKENQELEAKIMLQNESTRIEYEAQKMGMVPQEDTEIYLIAAPDPRPFERKVKTAAGI